MRIALVLIMAASLLGCADSDPVSSPWCDADAVILAGSWGAEESANGVEYRVSMDIRESDTDCMFTYQYRTYRVSDSLLAFEGRGDIYVTSVDTWDGLTRLTIERRRLYIMALDHHGNEVISHVNQIFDTSTVKIWDDAMSIRAWKVEFTRQSDAP